MILRDPVHGLVAFETEEERIVEQLLDTPEVQRLRRVRQLGVANVAFPGAEHTRFAHALGAAHVMKLLLARLRAIQDELPFWQRVTSDRAQDALAAALLHDLGHGPLSHLFEDAIPGTAHHEEWTEKILLDPSTGVHQVLAALDGGMPARVAALVRGEHPLPYLAHAVSGTLDVDRCDYLLRDAHATGVRYGVYDLDWLLRSLRFTPVTTGPGGTPDDSVAPQLAVDGAKGLPAIEAFILARLFMFQQVYLHKATRSAEWMIRRILRRATELLAAGKTLPSVPRAILLAAQGGEIPLADYLELDDAVLMDAMHAWERGEDAGLADLCRRVRVRHLYKTYELFGDQAAHPEGALAAAKDIARSAGLDPEIAVGLDVARDTPFGDGAEDMMVVFAKGPPRRLGEVSFLLGRLGGHELARTRILFAPELRDAIIGALSSGATVRP